MNANAIHPIDIIKAPGAFPAITKARADEAAAALQEAIEHIQQRVTRDFRAVDVIDHVHVQHIFDGYQLVAQVAEGAPWDTEQLEREIKQILEETGYADVPFYVSGWATTQSPSISI